MRARGNKTWTDELMQHLHVINAVDAVQVCCIERIAVCESKTVNLPVDLPRDKGSE